MFKLNHYMKQEKCLKIQSMQLEEEAKPLSYDEIKSKLEENNSIQKKENFLFFIKKC